MAYEKRQVRDVPKGTVVCFEGEWGVLVNGPYLDTWDVGLRKLKSSDIVEVLPPPSVALRHGRPKGPPRTR